MTLAACGSGSTGAQLGDCSGTPRAVLAVGTGFETCADSGLDPSNDGFRFANWSGTPTSDAFDASVAVALFGRESVCMDTSNGCVEYPAAKQWIEEMNAAISGGRCEGMAVLSQRVYGGDEEASELQNGARKTIDLAKDQTLVGESIARWWVSQTFPEVSSTTARSREFTPSRIAAEVARALVEKTGPTLGIYADGFGHAVTPIAVSSNGADIVRISTYDNNFPGEITHIDVDMKTNKWTYGLAASNADNASAVWTGGTGSMDLTLMADRTAQPTVPWADPKKSTTKGSATKNTEIMVTTGGVSKVGVLVHVGKHVVDSRDLSTLVAGVHVQPLMGGRYGTGAVVDIEPRVGNVTIEPVVGELLDHTAKEVAFTLGVEGPDQGAFEITATRSVAKLDKTLPSVELKDLDGRFSVRVHGSGEFTVDEASGEQEDIVHLHDSEQFVFAERADGTTEVNLRDASGRVLWRDRTTGAASARGYHVSEVSFDESRRRADVRVSPDTAQPLNEEVIAELSRP